MSAIQLISSKNIKARKDHVCSYCCEKINKGDHYKNSFIVDGSDGWSWKSHLECEKLVSFLNMMEGVERGEGLTQDDFWECLYEFYFKNHKDLPRKYLSKISPKEILWYAKTKMRIETNKNK